MLHAGAGVPAKVLPEAIHVHGAENPVTGPSYSGLRSDPACGAHGLVTDAQAGQVPAPCVHMDKAPPGVDLRVAASTADLKTRVGSGPAAAAAADMLGVAAPAGSVTDPSVPCDGDGTSGYRVQAMYVVEAGQSNRYDALQTSLKLWAAGVDDVFNRSAALTGGVRHVRFVTDGSGTCTARVLNITVPVGATKDFSSTISAVQNMGYTSGSRKYLMWVDAAGKGICGIASMYPDSSAGQANPNNGGYAMYARIDNPCWGSSNSVEAHELEHNLGAVQKDAPHATPYGHCRDDSDRMCYVDGPGITMMNVCPAEMESLLDCNNDDYYSTYPPAGSYLATHWNTASNRFLLGGGDGTNGGSPGAPTRLAATLQVNGPAIAGLATQAQVSTEVPAGRTVTAIAWTLGRKDCFLSAPTAEQTTITCPVTAAGSTTVTAAVTDSANSTIKVSGTLAFAPLTGTKRAVTLDATVNGKTGPAEVCLSAATPVRIRMRDAATGQPVMGLTATVARRTGTLSPIVTAGTISGADGVSAPALTVAAATDSTYTPGSKPGGLFLAAAGDTNQVTASQCAPSITANIDRSSVYYADPVTVTGTLTRPLSDGTVVPVAGAKVNVVAATQVIGSGTPTTKLTTLASPITDKDGRYTTIVTPTSSAAWSVQLPAAPSYKPASAALGDVAVAIPATRLTASVNATAVGYGTPITITGTLRRAAGGNLTALTRSTVTATITPAGAGAKPVTLASATVSDTGTFTITGPARTAGALTVRYAGTAGQPASTQDLGTLTLQTWQTTVTLSGPALRTGVSASVSGNVTKQAAGDPMVAAGVPVRLYLRPADGTAQVLLNAATTKTDGTFVATVRPGKTGTVVAVITGVAGYADNASAALTVR
ncbi:hypothetical protein KRMM14A1259_68770 [Krasilnikovia sp. MM14-A1259]